MNPNPLLGVIFHWLGGFASASFYVPYRKVKGWPWEIYWLIGGLFSWIVAPWGFAFVKVPSLIQVLSQASPSTIGYCVLFGLLWGLGGLTYGLTMRYLGLGLGTAVALSLCALFGTIMPPIFDGSFWTDILPTLHGQIVIGGLVLCLGGICVIGYGAHNREGDIPDNERQGVIKEYNLKKGIWVAIFCGLMSSCFAYGLAGGRSIQAFALAAGADPLFQGLPVLCVVLLGGAVTNIIWCFYLIVKNKSLALMKAPAAACEIKPSNLVNLVWCALAGVTWYLQFFFYTMGESQMGTYGFSSWTLHMASIIIFSSLWGFALKEWKGAKAKTLTLVMLGLTLLIASTVVIGLGNAMKG
jgi:L-rhamnose-H+ transport protein